jgi:decaprenyl-phosphate phosphoribosyltransferase
MSSVNKRTITPLLELFRPRQQVKNVLVFAAPVLAGIHWDKDAVISLGAAFIALVLVSASTYTFNDLRDRHIDALHPTKSQRPIARGAAGPTCAVLFAILTAVLALALAVAVNVELLFVVAIYAVTTTAYSLGLKHVPVLELVIVAVGFVIRILAGAAAVGAGVTDWFLIVIGSGALMVIIAKRESEERRIQTEGGTPRGVLASYSLPFLTAMRTTFSAVVLTTGCIATFAKAHDVSLPLMIQVSVIPYALVILEFNRVVTLSGAETPEQIAYTSRVVQFSGIAWILLILGGIYG